LNSFLATSKTMSRNHWSTSLGVVLLAASAGLQLAWAKDAEPAAAATAPIDLFQAIDDGQADVTFIAKNDHAGRVLITNNTKQPLNLRLPEAFAGVPVLAQFGGGGGGQFGGGGGGQFGGGGGQQTTGGGFGGGGGGLGGGGLGGGGGGFFSVPPEQTRKINVPLVCLDHGLRDPSSSKPYKMVPAAEHIDRPAVIELLKAFGRGQLQHEAAQAAAWHLNSNMSWAALAAKQQGTARTAFNRPPYFSAGAIRAGMAYASEAVRLAELNADDYRREYARVRDAATKSEGSESRSTSEMEGSVEVKSGDAPATDVAEEATQATDSAAATVISE
jgi:hypothetical protein